MDETENSSWTPRWVWNVTNGLIWLEKVSRRSQVTERFILLEKGADEQPSDHS